jgi:hypothetical protein
MLYLSYPDLFNNNDRQDIHKVRTIQIEFEIYEQIELTDLKSVVHIFGLIAQRILDDNKIQYRNINVKYNIKRIIIKIYLNIYLKTYNYLETLLYNELSNVIRYFARDHINVQLSKVVIY